MRICTLAHWTDGYPDAYLDQRNIWVPLAGIKSIGTTSAVLMLLTADGDAVPLAVPLDTLVRYEPIDEE